MEASDHRYRAREALRGNWVTAVLVCLVAGILSGSSFSSDININFEGGQPIQITLPEQYEEILVGVLGISLAFLTVIAVVISVVGLILGGVMEIGKARYHLNLIDGAAARFEDLFSAFPQFLSALVMRLVRQVLITLGMLLLVIPGVMLTFSYAAAPYIMAQDPECEGLEALRRSRELMKGNRMELFFLDLSFIGWDILSLLTLGIGSLFLNPYKEAARASFFRHIGLGYQGDSVEF
jgi:uncharacterized membrane protein